MTTTHDTLRIAGAQLAPVWLHRDGTIAKVLQTIEQAAAQHVQLLAFPEAFVPGYPFWIEHTDGARFDSALQKTMHAHYLDQAVQIAHGRVLAQKGNGVGRLGHRGRQELEARS